MQTCLIGSTLATSPWANSYGDPPGRHHFPPLRQLCVASSSEDFCRQHRSLRAANSFVNLRDPRRSHQPRQPYGASSYEGFYHPHRSLREASSCGDSYRPHRSLREASNFSNCDHRRRSLHAASSFGDPQGRRRSRQLWLYEANSYEGYDHQHHFPPFADISTISNDQF